MYITQALHRQIQRAADDIGVIDGDVRLTWVELGDRVARYAGAIRALGIEPGDRVAILARNGTHFIEFILGTLWAGAVINPINLRWTADEMAWSLVDCDTRILLIAPEFEPLLPEIRAKAPCLQHILAIGETMAAGVVPRSVEGLTAVLTPNCPSR